MIPTYIHDIEIFPNFFSNIFIEYLDYMTVRDKAIAAKTFEEKRAIYNTCKHKRFVIYKDRNDLMEMLEFLQQTMYLVGFHSNGFDNPILNYATANIHNFKSTKDTLDQLFEFTERVINLSRDDYWKDDLVKAMRYYKVSYHSVDLQTILAFDKMGKSLKQTGINLSWYRIQDLPKEPGTYVTDDEVDAILDYNMNDVLLTTELLHTIREDVSLRLGIYDKYKINVTSSSDSSIADSYFRKIYCDTAGIKYKDIKGLKTYHSWIHVGKCISPKIKFEHPTFKKLLEQLKAKKIQNTKGELDFNIEFDESVYSLATGGLHSKDKPALYLADEDEDLTDADVTSYYPSMVINERIYPAHLDEDVFIDVGTILKDDRVAAKNRGDHVTAQTLKIVINVGLFGKFGFEFSDLYDLEAMIKVTINGQLFLLMLIEMLTKAGFKVISANTDGVVAVVPHKERDEYTRICEQWEATTKLNLEYTNYLLYVRRDVNSYLTVKRFGKDNNDNKIELRTLDQFKDLVAKGTINPDNFIKRKGDFDKFKHIYGYPKLSKAVDMPIVAEAIEDYYIYGIDVMTTLYKCRNIHSFVKSQKMNKKFIAEHHTIKGSDVNIEELQKNVRYYVSTKGGALQKLERVFVDYDENLNQIFKESRTSICAGYVTTIINDYIHHDDFKDYNINYSYYYMECMKIINSVTAGTSNRSKHKKLLNQPKLF